MATVIKEDLEYVLQQLNNVSANKYTIIYHKGFVDLCVYIGDSFYDINYYHVIRTPLTKREAFGIIKSIIDYRYYEEIALKERYTK